MEFKADKNPIIRLTLDGKVEITFTTYKSALNELESFKDKDLIIKISKFSQKRSLSQNSYMWVLINELAIKLGESKDFVYRHFIKEFGVFEIIPIKNEAVDRFKRNWSKNGLGWFVEELGESKLKGFTKLIVYYGSSTYNSQEMSRLVDAVVSECELQGISTMTLKDIMLLKNENDTDINQK